MHDPHIDTSWITRGLEVKPNPPNGDATYLTVLTLESGADNSKRIHRSTIYSTLPDISKVWVAEATKILVVWALFDGCELCDIGHLKLAKDRREKCKLEDGTIVFQLGAASLNLSGFRFFVLPASK